MKKSEGGLQENIKRAFSAFAYEDSGEMLSRSGKSQALSGNFMDIATKENNPVVLNNTTDSK